MNKYILQFADKGNKSTQVKNLINLIEFSFHQQNDVT